MKIVFMGTPQAAAVSLRRLMDDGHEIAAVYSQPDRPSGRGNKVTHSPVKQFALENALELHQPARVRTDAALALFRSHDADVAVVVAYGRILPEGFLTAFPRGAVNVHFSLLPKYRGAAPVNWAIANGESKTGVTSMKMDTGLDTGDILIQRETVIGEGETSIGLMERLSAVGADLLSETVATFDQIVPRPQDHDLASHAPILKREDGLIDWHMSAAMVAARVRGFQPFPSAFTYFRETKLTIWMAAPVVDEQTGEAGQVLAAGSDDLRIACGDSTVLKIVEVQPEGKRRMPVRDFLNGFSIPAGSVLGK